MIEIVFATNNKHKLEEIRNIVGKNIRIISLEDISFTGDIEETEITIEGNALLKAKYIADRFNLTCFADDTGLEVEALGGAPGVYSARYAGEECSYQDNVHKLLQNLAGIDERNACFKTVIAFIGKGINKTFEGKICGEITNKQMGNGGFGYDPVFKPYGYDLTFAEMDSALKNKISHRAIATQKLIDFLAAEFKA